MARIFKYWKPTGVISSLNPLDPLNILNYGNLTEKNLQLLLSFSSSLPPLQTIGRLDKESSGLLLLTNSLEIRHQLTQTYNNHLISHSQDPQNQQQNQIYGSKYPKIYHIKTRNYVSNLLLKKLREGVSIQTMGRRKINPIKSNRKTLPCQIERSYNELFQKNEIKLQIEKKDRTNDLYFILREGRNRQIRKMIGSVGHSVESLCRLSIGEVTLEGLKGVGDLLPLTEREIELLEINNNEFIND